MRAALIAVACFSSCVVAYCCLSLAGCDLTPPSPPPPAHDPNPTLGATEAAIGVLRDTVRATHTVVPDSMRVLAGQEAAQAGAIPVGSRSVVIDRNHAIADRNRVVVVGGLFIEDRTDAFAVYLQFDPDSGRYQAIDVDLFSE